MWPFNDKKQLDRIEQNTKQIMINQAQFDTDLAGFLTAFGNLITAVDNYISSQTPADLTAEDNQLLTAAQTAATELNKLNPPAPVPVPPTPTP
jgi:hypothetical protein